MKVTMLSTFQALSPGYWFAPGLIILHASANLGCTPFTACYVIMTPLSSLSESILIYWDTYGYIITHDILYNSTPPCFVCESHPTRRKCPFSLSLGPSVALKMSIFWMPRNATVRMAWQSRLSVNKHCGSSVFGVVGAKRKQNCRKRSEHIQLWGVFPTMAKSLFNFGVSFPSSCGFSLSVKTKCWETDMIQVWTKNCRSWE